MKCGVCSGKRAVKCEVGRVQCEVRSVECEVLTAKGAV